VALYLKISQPPPPFFFPKPKKFTIPPSHIYLKAEQFIYFKKQRDSCYFSTDDVPPPGAHGSMFVGVLLCYKWKRLMCEAVFGILASVSRFYHSFSSILYTWIEFSRKLVVAQLARNSLPFMEPEASSLC
jgi:hypothetical protein